MEGGGKVRETERIWGMGLGGQGERKGGMEGDGGGDREGEGERGGGDLDLDLDLRGDLKAQRPPGVAHRPPGVAHDGAPDDAAYRLAVHAI